MLPLLGRFADAERGRKSRGKRGWRLNRCRDWPSGHRCGPLVRWRARRQPRVGESNVGAAAHRDVQVFAANARGGNGVRTVDGHAPGPGAGGGVAEVAARPQERVRLPPQGAIRE